MIDVDFDFLSDFVEDSSPGNAEKAVRVSLQKFLKVYVEVSRQGGNSISVAKELGISPQAVRQRAGKLILKGVNLPKLGNICRKQSSAVISD